MADTGKRAAKSPRKKTARTLAEQAYHLIKDRLVSARYAPGQFLQEADICEDLKLGRTPVHQALHRLQQENQLEVIPRKGVLIKTDSVSEIFTALEVRSLLEPYCAAQCAERATDADLDALRAIIGQYEKARKATDRVKLMELDRLFHATIVQVAGNSLILDFLRPIHERMSRIWFMPHWQFDDFDLTSREHGQILSALCKRDPAASSAAMSEHIETLRRRILTAGSGVCSLELTRRVAVPTP